MWDLFRFFAPRPNAAVLRLYQDQEFQALVANDVIDCTQIANCLQRAAGGIGTQITINPDPRIRDQVRFPTSRGMAEARYHTVFVDEAFVYDPRYRRAPIPRAEWEREVLTLNGGANVFGR